jgi:NTE family protein
MSGGGYRAMVFHLGALIRLNEIGLLSKLSRISSVSGGSITAAQLGFQWRFLQFINGVASNLKELVIDPIRSLAERTIDADSIIGGILMPGVSISDKIARAYRKYLFGDATLQDLPLDSEGPRFVINATNVQSGALLRFSRPFIADWKVGSILNPKVSLAVAVERPPRFRQFVAGCNKLSDSDQGIQPDPLGGSTYHKSFRQDGGVGDNSASRLPTLQEHPISDGGSQMQPEPELKETGPPCFELTALSTAV